MSGQWDPNKEAEKLRQAALQLLANTVPIGGSVTLVAVRMKDIEQLAEAAGYKK